MGLTPEALDDLPVESQVRDEEGAVWTKSPNGWWSSLKSGDYYHGWSAVRLSEEFSVLLIPTETEPEVVVEGVWIVWSSVTKETINGVFPADAEINALRMVNRDGYGHAEFQPFGEVTY